MVSDMSIFVKLCYKKAIHEKLNTLYIQREILETKEERYVYRKING